MDAKAQSEIKQALPFTRQASEAFLKELFTHGQIVSVKAGDTIYWEGDRCHSLPLALSGSFRVFKVGENGKEITLYRFGKGEGCILTTSCILHHGQFPAIARVEEAGKALLIPEKLARDWMKVFPEWQTFICSLISKRLAEVITTVEEIAFKRMDVRVVQFLLEKSKVEKDRIEITHQQIAYELGTAREVISRILKDLEMQGQIQLSRGQIRIVNPTSLQHYLKNLSM